ncbi:MAG: hypothetical protein QOF89_5941 [Acidobacteriota bacterium]|jgi:hypothetical protein|nr:hypothetical protein [Acidobacteriota bacterium]
MELGRVFISSVFGGMLDRRELAANAARLVGLEPVLTEHHVARAGDRTRPAGREIVRSGPADRQGGVRRRVVGALVFQPRRVGPRKLFFWKGKPAFLGSSANREKSAGIDTVLYLPGDAGPREVLMSCQKSYVRALATDATGYAAITDSFLVLGDLATAPDLP